MDSSGQLLKRLGSHHLVTLDVVAYVNDGYADDGNNDVEGEKNQF